MEVRESSKVIELTRRNLLALLAKLDGHPPHSACMIMRQGWIVKAVENDEHYSDRPPGVLESSTENRILDMEIEEHLASEEVDGG